MQCLNVSNQCIETHYMGPTNLKPARIVSIFGEFKIYVSFDHEFNARENHIIAANKLIEKHNLFGLPRESFQLISAWNRHNEMMHIPIISQ